MTVNPFFNFWEFLIHNLHTSPLSDMWFTNSFPHLWLVLILRSFNFDRVQFIIFVYVCKSCFCYCTYDLCINQDKTHTHFSLVLSSGNFTILDSLFEFIFVCGMRYGLTFVCIWIAICSRTICGKDILSSPSCLCILLKINWPYTCGSISGLCTHTGKLVDL